MTPTNRDNSRDVRHHHASSYNAEHLATTLIARGTVRPRTVGGTGADMLFSVAFVVLAGWLLGLLGAYDVGDLFHGLLLVGLMLFLLAFLRARDAALRRPAGGPPRSE